MLEINNPDNDNEYCDVYRNNLHYLLYGLQSVMNLSELSVIIPCFNENPKILDDITNHLKTNNAEVIIVDDGSTNPYPKSIKHGCNYGYGAALMTGIKNSTRATILTMDGDSQHTIQDVYNLFSLWLSRDFDMIVGVRKLKYESTLRKIGRKFLNTIAEIVSGKKLPDLNSGMRIFDKNIVIGYFPILCKRFSFTTSLTMSMMLDGYKVGWTHINVKERLHGKSHVKVVKDGLVTLYYILRLGAALRTRGIRKIWREKIKSRLFSH